MGKVIIIEPDITKEENAENLKTVENVLQKIAKHISNKELNKKNI